MTRKQAVTMSILTLMLILGDLFVGYNDDVYLEPGRMGALFLVNRCGKSFCTNETM
jgi:hypothetical protein